MAYTYLVGNVMSFSWGFRLKVISILGAPDSGLKNNILAASFEVEPHT